MVLRVTNERLLQKTGDIVQNVYLRKAELKNGKWVNVEFDKFDMVKDPAKEGK